MSSNAIKENITRLLKERNWSILDLDKKAGTNRNVYMMFHGRNNNPSATLVQQIAKTLNVGYKEILDEPGSTPYINDYSLFLKVVSAVIEELKNLPKNIHVSYDAVFSIVHEVCTYMNKFNNKKVDTQFVKWTIMKYYSLDSLNE